MIQLLKLISRTLTEDVTDRFNEFMKQVTIDCEYIKNMDPAHRLVAFYNLVKSGAEYDLKTKPEWQQSVYIYEGELVDKDALGNINYGYLGTYLCIPDILLLPLAGGAQVIGGTSELSYALSYFDDPKDQARIVQGIEKYKNDNPHIKPDYTDNDQD